MNASLRKLYALLIFHVTFCAQAQRISGVVRDDAGQGLPFATIYQRGTTDGTSSNIQGAYFLDLPPGESQVIFQFVGYKSQVFEVNLDQDQELVLDVTMAQETIQLKELVVTGDGRDPAYYIMQQAIDKRKYHLNEVRAYQCDVYVKGMQTIDKKPDKLLGFAITADTGIVYLSESVSVLSYLRPGKIKERMISSKVSGDNQAFSYNQASEMLVNFYENVLTAEGLSERGFISPLANGALGYYNYRLAGIFEEGGEIVNKIQVIPKRRNDPVFSGYIYILENSWRIHSVDLSLSKENQIEFLENLYIKQVYAPVEHGIWMMLSQKFTFDLKVFGFEGRGNFLGVHSNYKIEPTYPIKAVGKKESEAIEIVKVPKRGKGKKRPQPDSSIFENERKFFNNEVLVIESESNQRNTDYWERVRPMPLTDLEKKDYLFKDSLRLIIESQPYKDSIDEVSNKLNPENILFSGYMYRNSFKESYFSFDPLVNIMQFNTVEGAVLNLKMLYTKLKENKPYWRVIPEVRYGFASREFYAQARAVHFYDLKKFARIQFSGGRFVSQFNERNPIPYWLNTFYTLLYRENYLKLYEKHYVNFDHQYEFTNGLFLDAKVEYSHRTKLQNTSDFSVFREGEYQFSSNDPANRELNSTAFPTHQGLTLELLWRIRFGQKYISRPDRKFIVESKYPRVNVMYETGIPALGSDINYHLLELSAHYPKELGLLGDASLVLKYGQFLSAERLYFMDFKHFDGSQVAYSNYRNSSFQLLPYYEFSTRDRYVEGHYEHHFNGFIFNKLPLLRKTKAQVVVGLNYLNTPEADHYVETGIGLEHIFKIGRIDYFRSYMQGSFLSQGVRFGIGF